VTSIIAKNTCNVGIIERHVHTVNIDGGRHLDANQYVATGDHVRAG